MTEYSPLVLISGAYSQLPPGDFIEGVSPGTVTPVSGLGGGGDLNAGNVSVFIQLSANPSGLIFANNRLGFDGVSLVNSAAASASGNVALSTASRALASGNSALSLASTALASGNAALSAVAAAGTGAANSATFTASGPLLSGTPVGFDNRGFVQAVFGSSPTNNGFNNFLGVARSAAASGGTVTVDFADTIVTNQTGLTTGSIYYVNPTTSGFTTASGRPASWTGAIPWAPVGRAVSTSGLLLFNTI